MAAAAKVTRQAWDEQHMELMAPCIVESSPWALLDDPAAAFADTQLWQVEQGDVCALFALRGVQLVRGRMLDVVGMRSLGERVTPDTAAALDFIARTHYRGVDMLAMTTRYPHLVRACERAGWSDVARIAIKPLRIQ